ncbi:ABC transporter substrate-binding protein [Aquisalimonas asiatica]|uniref:Iron(III) transport system substrate-binding protein n=1 Tax=Aquisalimonas asiatica TaxID=406100 RepID=A0A1H8T020_9GAMM|nr:ABC transporter substrate-binding protein [Aquisalimonas asiatica]SEO83948.1 iron(III) transport system substrate-binding protein [Aquisalimonas asiatica]
MHHLQSDNRHRGSRLSRMRRRTACAALLALSLLAVQVAAEPTVYPAPAGGDDRVLTVFDVMEPSAAEPLIDGFQNHHPNVTVHYHYVSTRELYQRFLWKVGTDDADVPDLLLSSAMDHQMKLANDGYATPHRSRATEALPEWARWRDEAFAFSFEPVVLIYNREHLEGDPPGSRFELLERLQTAPERYRFRVGAYDPVSAGAGYLVLTQDAEHSPIFWELTQVFGSTNLRTFPHAADMLDRVAEGELLLAYGLPGSYARAWAKEHSQLGVVLMEDYTLAFSRVALIPEQAQAQTLARQYLDFLLSREGQRIMAGPSGLYAIRPDIDGEHTYAQLATGEATGRLRPIRLGPGLLVYQDGYKRGQFLDRWQRLTGDHTAPF